MISASRIAVSGFALAAASIAAFAAAFGGAALAADAPAWTIDAEKSRLGFVATQSGAEFDGAFSDWTADIKFDPDNLAGSSISATVTLKSAKTGDKERDSALPGRDWFNVKKTPTATFAADEIIAAPDGEGYVAKGALTLRGVEKPLDLAFDVDIADGRATARGEAVIARGEFGVGQGEFASGKWVGLDVKVQLNVVAAR